MVFDPKLIIEKLPTQSGVYLMKSDKGEIIYVGKAKNLRSRVKQYFSKEADTRYQIQFLVRKIKDIDFIVTASEQEALLLENSLIKKHKPRYNIFLKDDKSYLSIKFTTEDEYPKLFTTRKIKKDGAEYFGPYSRAESAKEIVNFLNSSFKLRTCSDHDFKHRSRPCLEYQINRCSAPCVNYVTKDEYLKNQIEPVRLFLKGHTKELLSTLKQKMEITSNQQEFEKAVYFRDLIKSIDQIMEKQNVVSHLGYHQDIIHLYSEDHQFLASVLQVREGLLINSRYFPLKSYETEEELIENFLNQYYLNQEFIPDEILISHQFPQMESLIELLSEKKGKKITIRKPLKGEKKNLIELARQNSQSQFYRLIKKELSSDELLEKLVKSLKLTKTPHRIECYDISNIFGKHATGSRVVFIDGKPNKKEYRHYKITTKDTPDDFAMMYEVLTRRFSKKENLPQLLMVDGGRAQLNIALKVLSEQNLIDIETIGIAKGSGVGVRAKGEWEDKKQEEIIKPNRKNPIILKASSPELKLLQNIRDESHRFALKYHQKLRDELSQKSFLNEIKGLGRAKINLLYEKFQTQSGILNASLEELESVGGIDQEIAKAIKAYQKD